MGQCSLPVSLDHPTELSKLKGKELGSTLRPQGPPGGNVYPYNVGRRGVLWGKAVPLQGLEYKAAVWRGSRRDRRLRAVHGHWESVAWYAR